MAVHQEPTIFDWREVVQRVEGENYWTETLYPVVYIMTGKRLFRDSGPESGIYEKAP